MIYLQTRFVNTAKTIASFARAFPFSLASIFTIMAIDGIGLAQIVE